MFLVYYGLYCILTQLTIPKKKKKIGKEKLYVFLFIVKKEFHLTRSTIAKEKCNVTGPTCCNLVTLCHGM